MIRSLPVEIEDDACWWPYYAVGQVGEGEVKKHDRQAPVVVQVKPVQFNENPDQSY